MLATFIPNLGYKGLQRLPISYVCCIYTIGTKVMEYGLSLRLAAFIPKVLTLQRLSVSNVC